MIGKKIKDARIAAGLTQAELGNRIGKNLRTIQKYEHGDVNLSYSVIQSIAKELNVSPEFLIDSQASPSKQDDSCTQSKRALKFNLNDILLLLDPSSESEDKIILSEQINEDSWVIAPMNSKLIRVEDNLNRKVESITVNGGMLQIWLDNENNG